mgnify:CR=1 FL=1
MFWTEKILFLLRRHTVVAVPAIYVVMAALYIVASDLLVHNPANSREELYINIAKGLAFVAVTGLLLWLLLSLAFVPMHKHRAVLLSHAALLEALPNVFLEVDSDGRLIGWNANALRLIGKTPEDLAGQPVAMLIAEGDGVYLNDALHHMRDIGVMDIFDARLRMGDGSAVLFAWHSALRQDRTGAYLLGVDISGVASIRSVLSDTIAGKRGVLRQSVDAIVHALELRDPYTSGHQTRVAALSVAIGRRLGLPDDRIEGLQYGGLLHDLGKIAVPSEYLVRPGQIDPLEMEMIRHHTRRGFEVLSHIDFPWPVADVALHHHERFDGSGYPDGLVGEAISLEARIVGIADVVDAMTSHRPYRPALGLDSALAEIRDGAGTLYDAAVAEACVTCLTTDSELSTLVKLSPPPSPSRRPG